jgi:hypothetical protein
MFLSTLRLGCIFVLTHFAFAQSSSLSISPELITQCTAGVGRATLTWTSSGPGLVQVRIGDAHGAPMTGQEALSGSAQNGRLGHRWHGLRAGK